MDDVRIPLYADEAVQWEMYQRYRRGAPPKALVRRFGLNVTGVRTRLARVRYQRFISLPLAPVPNDDFPRAMAAWEKAVLGPAPAPAKPPQRVRPPAGLPPYLTSLYEVPLLTREQEVHLFRKMNYLKYKASKLIARLDPEHPDNRLLDRIEQLYRQSVEVKNEIIRANLRLVVAMTKRYAHSTKPLLELVSDGNISLMRAVEKFDYARGFRFSTYATWAIIKNFTQSISREYRDRSRFRNAGEEVFRSAPDRRTNQQVEEAVQVQREGEIAQLLKQLDDRERQIIRYRYGLDSDREPMTLKEVGSAMGVSKERIRQLATRAIAKLRQAAVEKGLNMPEGCRHDHILLKIGA
ncbi:MAG: sigma-70 family RNA polymerase sigma factor [Pirellulales bacterium]|nr:sigma-70 family RNA polymerase sigma factor [Pirellulales bacterium]